MSDALTDPRNSMTYWWPLLENAAVPMPETRLLEVDGLMAWWGAYAGATEGEGPLPPGPPWLSALTSLGEEFGYPLFMRTDLASAKHGWRDTCHVASRERLMQNLFGLLDFCENAMMGAPSPKAVVLRELLRPRAMFTAFHGGLPIGQERRYFVRDGQVECHHSYWPEAAVRRPDTEEWRPLLAEANAEHTNEVTLLTSYAEELACVLEGYWSLDFMHVVSGQWYFIDAALGECSWHPECEFAEGDCVV